MLHDSNTSFAKYIPHPEEKLRQLALGMAVRSRTDGNELLLDNFAGGGGASLGIEWAYGRSVDIAINHDGEALVMHSTNHPETAHYQEDVFDIHPAFITGQRPIGLAWFSPDCKHHSKAKGGKPRDQKIRGLAWVALKWGALCRPRRLSLENVAELLTWGPLDVDGKAIKMEAGRTFKAFVSALTVGIEPDHPDVAEIYETLGADFPMEKLYKGLGYKVEYRVLKASDYGIPTTRTRLYMYASADDQPIMWPQKTHGDPNAKGFEASGLKPWITAAQCIDFTLPSLSIFGRDKELALNTKRRIAKGLWRHVLTSERPFFIEADGSGGGAPIPEMDRPVRAKKSGSAKVHTVASANENMASAMVVPLRGTTDQHLGGHSAMQPLSAVAASGQHHAVSAVHLTKFNSGSIGAPMDEPVPTVTAGGTPKRASTGITMGVVGAHLITVGYGERKGQEPRTHAVNKPLGTTVTTCKSAVAQTQMVAYLEQANGGFYRGEGRTLDAPLSVVTSSGSQQQLVTAYCVKYYSSGGQWQGLDEPMHTIPTKSRMGLVETKQVNPEFLTAEQRAGARACAQLLHEHLPEHFPEPAEVVLVSLKGQVWALIDISLRMLVPRELARAQGFPDDYVIAPMVRREVKTRKAKKGGAKEWRLVQLSQSAQVRMIGNSVCPKLAQLILQVNNYQQQLLQRHVA
ncbi:DNA cytosine methyltransferase [Comamonas testosteroni]|jgi:DNA (cytosine-5)-methyltransferase 1|uniref:DNA cytosine methyltransferase n=1 Tax=Comamonas testosteroni TaxID=285 RepID=UPI0026EB985F|nr:DNA cytosine methyltransferase [Comamonas testosteroni]